MVRHVECAFALCSLVVVVVVLSSVSVVSGAFPKDFIWGSATASYQIEGQAYKDGRLPSEWDLFSHTPGKTADGATGDVADRSYDLFDTDHALMADVGFKFYRFSFAWGRLIDASGRMNPVGVAHYRAMLTNLIAKGIQPFATLFHWDLPLIYSSMNASSGYQGWLNAAIVPRFVDYADLVFSNFGDLVKHWLTFNEPLSFCQIGYDVGVHAPGRCSNRSRCSAGDSTREPYLCTHHVLLSHAATVKLFRAKYQPRVGGVIGITLNSDWSVPLTDSPADRAAAQRSMDFMLGWFADPIFLGDYPASMKQLVGSRLPVFTDDQKASLKGSHDFFGLNHYTSAYLSDQPHPTPTPQGWFDDQHVQSTRYKDGVPIGPQAASDWLFVVPWAFKPLLHYVYDRYKSPIYITENGVDVPNEDILPLTQALNDTFRIDYYNGYLGSVEAAINEGVDVRGYFAWSLLDNFEWADGYSKRFGLHYVDYKDNERRYPKASSRWFKNKITLERARSRAPPHHLTMTKVHHHDHSHDHITSLHL